ncbi:hypothetical protein [Halosolutus halophilus]|uniref:hypothetical protein n=1 Tax=Halosolutus halophilus TaxID=1552990 RepID=UPI0022350909|nr:hypothetical protein [Halosolutus halophilus]
MDKRFPDGLSGEVEKVNNRSDKALYQYLQLHIFGPYTGDCEAFLNEVKIRLQKHRFKRAKICSDREDEPPNGISREEKAEFWRDVSYDFADHADTAVFIFLEGQLDRADELPDRAFKDEPFGHGETPSDLNSSPIQELNYWLREIDAERERTLVLFEGDKADDIGPVFRGEVSKEGVDVDEIDANNPEQAFKRIHGVARNWAMDTCKQRLQDRYIRDTIDEGV